MLDNAFSRAAACFFCMALIFGLVAATTLSGVAQFIALTAAALFAVTYLLGNVQSRPVPARIRIARRRSGFSE